MFNKVFIEKILNNTNINKEKYLLTKNRLDEPVLKINLEDSTFFINSKYNSKKEGESFANQYYRNTKNIIVYGLGMGFHIKALADKITPEQNLFVIECNKEIIKIALENTDILSVFQRDNVYLIAHDTFENTMLEIKDIFLKKDMTFICHEPSVRAIPKGFEKIKDIFETYLIKVRSTNILGDLLKENEKVNLTKGYENGGKVFKDAYKNKPAIIVSAGPSLEINGEKLKNLKDKAIIISVGRALKYLKSIGVKPDFSIITDPKESVINQLDFDETEISLFFLSTIHPTVEKYKGPKYILFEEHSDKVSDSDKIYTVETGGSVATTAFSLARLMGCNPLILIGQDLCYHSQKMHSGEETSFIDTKTRKTVLGIDGNYYSTPLNLYEYLKWFRKFAEKHKELKLINCTAKGAFIEGFEHTEIDKIF